MKNMKRFTWLLCALTALFAMFLSGYVLGSSRTEENTLHVQTQEQPETAAQTSSSLAVQSGLESESRATSASSARTQPPADTGTSAQTQPQETADPTAQTQPQETFDPSAPAGPTAAPPDADEPGKININTATAAELTALPGIGEVKAQRIVDYREENGAFVSVEQLTDVNGIGEKTLEKLRDYVTVG